jgi:hypothetical protein
VVENYRTAVLEKSSSKSAYAADSDIRTLSILYKKLITQKRDLRL